MTMFTDFDHAPFRHGIQDSFFTPQLWEKVGRTFAELGEHDFELHPTGYRFAVCRAPEILRYVYSASMRARLEQLFGRKVKRSGRYPVPQFYEFPETSAGLPPHTDADEQRDVAMIIYLNEDWSDAAGGELVVMSSPESEARVIEPRPNRAAVLELHPGAWHAVRPTRGTFRRRTLIVDWDFA